MNIDEALARSTRLLKARGIDGARLESEILMKYVLTSDRVALYVNADRALTPDELSAFEALLERRISHEPAAYLTGRKEFFGLSLNVSHSVLIPRPESELIVEKAIALADSFGPDTLVADIGTGCGAIALALAYNLPGPRIYATDISSQAIDVARLNCEALGLTDRIRLLHGDLLDPVPEPVDLIVANLPYVRTREIPDLPPEVRLFEPLIALDGGHDGLRCVERLLSQASGKLNPRGMVLLEVGCDQAPALTRISQRYFPHFGIEIFHDLAGCERAALIRAVR